MKTILYTGIDATEVPGRQATVFKLAQQKGYDLVEFAGWDDNNLRGPLLERAEENRKLINEFLDLFPVDWGLEIYDLQTTR